MKNRNFLLIGFLVLALAQLAVPMQMIYHNNDIVQNGKIYKFKAQPIDPYDAFRGKYIHLNFNESTIYTKDSIADNKSYVAILGTDKKGFAKIAKLRQQPLPKEDYITLSSIYSYRVSENDKRFYANINFPFNRFYMNEYKVPKAEETYNSSVRDTSKNVYALVAVKDGEAIIKDVLVDGVSIKDYVVKRK
ncbi:MAG: GDYXXLXY domain-containing protein [Bacteroidota bacterium]